MKISENDFWVVLGPGRTGSKFITYILCNLYWQNYRNLMQYQPFEKIETINKYPAILHTHNYSDLLKIKNIDSKIKTNLIISTRDMVDSALSWVLVEKTKVWHVYNYQYDDNLINLEPLNIDMSRFYYHYHNCLYFYENVSNLIDRDKITIIDYKDLDRFIGPLYLIQKLKIENRFSMTNIRIPIKNNICYEKIILNWPDFLNETKDLQRIPNI